MELIENVRMEVVSNGSKICYTRKTPKGDGRHGEMECDYKYEEEVYQDDQDGEAMKRYGALRKKQRGNINSKSPMIEVTRSYD